MKRLTETDIKKIKEVTGLYRYLLVEKDEGHNWHSFRVKSGTPQLFIRDDCKKIMYGYLFDDHAKLPYIPVKWLKPLSKILDPVLRQVKGKSEIARSFTPSVFGGMYKVKTDYSTYHIGYFDWIRLFEHGKSIITDDGVILFKKHSGGKK